MSALRMEITAAYVEANRKSHLSVPEGERQKLTEMMKPTFKGLSTESDLESFWNYKSTFFSQITNLKSIRDSPELHAVLTNFMDYCYSVVNHSTSTLFLSLFKHFKGNPTENDMEKANYFAWAVYTLNATYFPIDDIADGATVRRFKPTYHTHAGEEETWLNTMMVMDLLIEGVMEKFKGEIFGMQLLNLFAFHKSRDTSGQLLDMRARVTGKQFDMEYRIHHNECFTSSAYGFPVEAAALMAGRHLNPREIEQSRKLGFAICTLFRDNNDMVDAFPDLPHGKPLYVDIINGSCTWLSATAWAVANEKQREILKNNYGFDDNEKIAAVLQVFEDLDMRSRFKLQTAVNLKAIRDLIDKFPEDLAPKETFVNILSFGGKALSLAWS